MNHKNADKEWNYGESPYDLNIKLTVDVIPEIQIKMSCKIYKNVPHSYIPKFQSLKSMI